MDQTVNFGFPLPIDRENGWGAQMRAFIQDVDTFKKSHGDRLAVVEGRASVSRRQTVLEGPRTSEGMPNLFTVGEGASVVLNVSASTPAKVAMAAGFDGKGALDLVAIFDQSLTVPVKADGISYIFGRLQDGAKSAGYTDIKPFYSEMPPEPSRNSAIPALSANVSALGTAFASSEGGGDASRMAYRAMDGVASVESCWASNWVNQNQHIGFEFPTPVKISGYEVYPKTDSVGQNFTDFVFEVTNEEGENAQWTVLDSKPSIDWSGWAPAGGNVVNEVAYKRCRVRGNGSGPFVAVAELKVYTSDYALNTPWFDKIRQKMYFWNGTDWEARNVTFMGQCEASGGVVTSVTTYAYRGRFETVVPAVSNSNSLVAHNLGIMPGFVSSQTRAGSSYGWQSNESYVDGGGAIGGRTSFNELQAMVGFAAYVAYNGPYMWGGNLAGPTGYVTTGQCRIVADRGW